MMLRTLFLGLAFLAVAPVDSVAQARTEDPRSTAKVHLGGFYLKPTIELKELGVDTNVFNESNGGRKDFTFTLTPGLTTSLPLARRGLLQLLTSADLIYYQHYDTERAFNPKVAARVEAYFNRLTLFANPTYARLRDRQDTEIDKRALRVEQGTSAGGEVRLLPKLSVEGTVQHLRTRFDTHEVFYGSSLDTALSRNSLSFGVGIRWTRTPLTTIIVRGDSLKDRFLVSPLRNGDSTRVLAGVELKPRALISGMALVGMRKFEPLNVLVPSFTGLVSSAALRYTLLETATFRATVDRDLSYSFEPYQPYYVSTTWGGTAQRHLAGRFDALIGFERQRSAYHDLLPDAPSHMGAQQRVDITDFYSGSIGYRVGDAARFGVGLSYWMRNSNTLNFRDYNGFRFRTTFDYGLQ